MKGVIMENKFKVGDIVTGISNKYLVTNKDMKRGLVTEVSNNSIEVKVLEHKNSIWVGSSFHVIPFYFKKVEDEHDWKLVIIPDGNETKAMYYKDGKFVEKVTCRKHPDDEYSEKVACETLINRLFGEDTKDNSEKDEPKFKVGDFVEVTKGDLKGLRGFVAEVGGIILVDFKIEYPWGHRGLRYSLPKDTGKYFRVWELKKV